MRLPRALLKDPKGHKDLKDSSSLPTPTSKAVLPANGVAAALAPCLALLLATCHTPLTLLLLGGSPAKASLQAVLVLPVTGKTSLSLLVGPRVVLDLMALLRLESLSRSLLRLPLGRMERLLLRLPSNRSHRPPLSRLLPQTSVPTARLAPTKEITRLTPSFL